MFFRGVELRETGAQKARLPVFIARGDQFLLHAKFYDPYFRAVVIRAVADDHKLENGIVRNEIEFVVKLGDQRTKFFKKSDADGLQIDLRFSRRLLVVRISRPESWKITIHSNGLGVGGDSPLGGAEKHADVRGIEIHHARRNGIAFDRLIDSRENDDLFCDMHDDAATGQIGDDFVLVALRETRIGGGRGENRQQERQTPAQEAVATPRGDGGKLAHHFSAGTAAAAALALASSASKAGRSKYWPLRTTARILRVFEIFSTGFAPSSTRSAVFPSSTVPKSCSRPRNCAAPRVAARMASSGVNPA